MLHSRCDFIGRGRSEGNTSEGAEECWLWHSLMKAEMNSRVIKNWLADINVGVTSKQSISHESTEEKHVNYACFPMLGA